MTTPDLTELAKEAAVFTTDYWFLIHGADAFEAAMIAHFSQWPGFSENVQEGQAPRNACSTIMENAFETFAWNNHVDPNELFNACNK